MSGHVNVLTREIIGAAIEVHRNLGAWYFVLCSLELMVKLPAIVQVANQVQKTKYKAPKLIPSKLLTIPFKVALHLADTVAAELLAHRARQH